MSNSEHAKVHILIRLLLTDDSRADQASATAAATFQEVL